jgi:hypothetical protein
MQPRVAVCSESPWARCRERNRNGPKPYAYEQVACVESVLLVDSEGKRVASDSIPAPRAW